MSPDICKCPPRVKSSLVKNHCFRIFALYWNLMYNIIIFKCLTSSNKINCISRRTHKTWICPWSWGFQGWRESETLVRDECIRKGLWKLDMHRLTFVAYVVLETPCFHLLQKGRLHLRELNRALALCFPTTSLPLHPWVTHSPCDCECSLDCGTRGLKAGFWNHNLNIVKY